MVSFGKTLIFAAAIGLGSLPAAAAGDAKPIAVELNKLDAVGKGCRAYFVVDNPGDKAFQSLKLDFVFFSADGVINRRLVVDLAPLRAGKKSVKTFDLDNPPCAQIASILLNDVVECRDAAGPQTDCLQHVRVSSRAKVPLTK